MERVLYCFYKITLEVRADLKRHNRVYTLSSKHSYRPMGEHVVLSYFINPDETLSLVLDILFVKLLTTRTPNGSFG